MISRGPFQLQLFFFSVKIFSYLALLLKPNVNPSQPGFPFGHLVLKDTSTYILLLCKLAYLFLQEFYNRRQEAE